MLAPLALGAIHRLAVADRFSFGRLLLAVGSVGAIVIVHNISTLWIGPMLAAYSAALIIGVACRGGEEAAGTASVRRLVLVTAAGLVALGLTAFFWLPALTEENLVQLFRLRTNDFDVRNAFLTIGALLAPPTVVDQTAANPPPYFHLGWGQLLLAVVTIPLAAFALQLHRPAAFRREWNLITHLGFGWCLLIASAAMTLPLSTPVWRHLPLLAYTEYPWRLLELCGIATALLAGITVHLGLRLLRQVDSSALVRTGFVGLALLVLVGSSLVYLYPRTPFLTFGELTAAGVTVVHPAPRPADPSGGHLARSSLAAGDRATFLGSSGSTERYTLALINPATVKFNLLNFPGWQVEVNGQAVETRSTVPDGLLLADLPAGSHEVVLSFGDTPIRFAGWLIAGFTVVLLVIGGLLQSRRSKSTPEIPAPSLRSIQSDPPQIPGLTGRGVAVLGVGFLIIAFLRDTNPAPYAAVFARQSPLEHVIGITNPLRVFLGDQVELLGYDLSTTTVKPGDDVTVTLYWRPLGHRLSLARDDRAGWRQRSAQPGRSPESRENPNPCLARQSIRR